MQSTINEYPASNDFFIYNLFDENSISKLLNLILWTDNAKILLVDCESNGKNLKRQYEGRIADSSQCVVARSIPTQAVQSRELFVFKTQAMSLWTLWASL